MFNMPIGFCGGYGHVTNASIANFPYINVLPMMMTNYGGDLQLTTIEPYAGYNTQILFNGPAQQSYGVPGFVNSPYMTADMGAIQASASAMAQSNLAQIYSQYASQFINTGIATIDNAIKAYEAKIANADTPADQKAIMEEAVKDLKAKKEELEKMKTATDMEPSDAYTKSKEIKEAIDKTIREVNSKLSGAAPASSTPADSSASSEQAAAADSSATGNQPAATGDQSAQMSAQAQQAAESQQAATQGGSGEIDNFNLGILNDTDAFHKAVAGLGTSDKVLEDIIDTHANDGTMLELMLCYNNKYGDAKKESFIEAFMDDEDHEEALDMLPKIVNALVTRAKAMGVYDDEFRQWEIAITRETTASDWGFLGLDAIFSSIDDDVVCENIDKMVKKMGEKLGSRYASVQKTES